MADKFQNKLAWTAIGGLITWLLVVLGVWFGGQALVADEEAHAPSEWRTK